MSVLNFTKREDNQHASDCPDGRIGSCEGQTASDDEQQELATQAGEVDLASADLGHQEPRASCTDHTKSRICHRQRERVFGVHARLGHKVTEVAHEILATQRLYSPDADHDLSTAKVDASEAVHVRCSFFGELLHLVGVLDHGNGFVDVEARLICFREAE